MTGNGPSTRRTNGLHADQCTLSFIRCTIKSLAILLICAAAPAWADIIVDIEGAAAGQFALSNSSSSEESWFSPVGYNNVSIAPWLVNLSGRPLQMTYFLTTSIGPGTTISDQVSSGNFTLPAGFSDFDTVVSGLTLGPGSYFLSFLNSCPGAQLCAGWEIQGLLGASTILGPGVTVADGVTGVGAPFAPYFPATQFFDLGNGLLQLRVESVPEPSAFWPFTMGLVALAITSALRRFRIQAN